MDDNFHRFSYVQRQWLERLIDEDLAFLCDLILGDAVEVCEAFVQEGRDVLQFLEHLCIVALLYKLDQLFKDLFYVPYFFLVCVHDLLFVHQSLLLSLVFALEFTNDVELLLFNLSLQFGKSILDVVELQLHQPLKFFAHLAQQSLVFIDEAI